jgi:hypothetical protein
MFAIASVHFVDRSPPSKALELTMTAAEKG